MEPKREEYIDFSLGDPNTTNILVRGQLFNLPLHLMEHLSAIESESNTSIMNMEQSSFQDKGVQQALKAPKNKATCPDNMRDELF